MSSSDKTATQVIVTPPGQWLRVNFEAIDLRVVEGPDLGLEKSFCLSPVRIGTAADNDFILSDRAVSRHHAEIRTTQQGLLLRDLGSTNGTFIGKVKVESGYLAPETECLMGYSHVLIRQRTEERQVPIPKDNQLGALVGASARMRELYGIISAVAPTPTTVQIFGESGSGKELVARTIHEISGRKGALVVFDASVADPEMVRNDLFGHVKGAFTGATSARKGAFRQAEGGTLFIDEIGELPLELQSRLLRVLENREVTPIGSDTPERVDVRVVTATHRDLKAMVQEGEFRADLFFRLSVFPLSVPSLREIPEDIPMLVDHFIRELSLNCRVSPEAMTALQRYSWPGNVRELRNVIERAAVLREQESIRVKDLQLPENDWGEAEDADAASIPTAQLKDIERKTILDALARNDNNRAATARELGISLSTLKRRLKDYED